MTDSIKLYNIDCIEYMKSVPDKYFDLAVVDPPYGIGDTFIGFSSGAKKGKLERIHKEIKWDNATPTDEYFSELKRISKKQIIWGANYFNSFCSGGALIWYKNRGGNTLSQCEIASVSGQKKVDYIPLQILTGFCSNEERIHPTQKPVALYDWILEKYKPSLTIMCFFLLFKNRGNRGNKKFFKNIFRKFTQNIIAFFFKCLIKTVCVFMEKFQT